MKNYKRKLRLNDIKSINNLMARVINSLIDETISEQDARALGYLANILYKGLEQADNQELKKEYQKAQIENMKARTQSYSELGQDIEDISAIRKAVFGNDDPFLEVFKGGKQ